MNRINVSKGDIGFNFTDNNVIKKIDVDKLTQTQLINGRLAIARLVINNSGECEYAIIPASVADKNRTTRCGQYCRKQCAESGRAGRR
ncbi:nucleoprotein/polynucleotide-associated enzyme [Salmonella enterica subsp. enterica serovar Heidelberg str. N18440]|nr:nucleoprotein/polynucleotide-associated enzyme [Salmonella enterica subsp. enterica serovar Heidelberg str. N18440]